MAVVRRRDRRRRGGRAWLVRRGPADPQPLQARRAGGDRRSRGAHDDGRARRRALDPGRRPHAARRRARRDLDADAPRAPRAHLLALSVALHARPDPRALRRGRPRGRAARAAARAAALQGAGVRDGRRRAASCAGASSAACSSRAPATAATATCRSTCAAASRSTRDTARVHVEVEVANFYPALASGVARWFYAATQSRIHVIVTHGFLRSLARLDLAESVVGRYADAGRRARPAAGRRASTRPRDRGRGACRLAPIAREVAAALLDGRAPEGIVFADGYPSQFSLEVMDILAGPRAATPDGAGLRPVLRRAQGRRRRRRRDRLQPDAESTAQLGYSIVEPCQGRGYATDALRALIARLRADPRRAADHRRDARRPRREPAGHGEGRACGCAKSASARSTASSSSSSSTRLA